MMQEVKFNYKFIYNFNLDTYDFLSKQRGSDVQPASNEKYMKLPQYDMSEFKNLSVAGDVKELLSIMQK